MITRGRKSTSKRKKMSARKSTSKRKKMSARKSTSTRKKMPASTATDTVTFEDFANYQLTATKTTPTCNLDTFSLAPVYMLDFILQRLDLPSMLRLCRARGSLAMYARTRDRPWCSMKLKMLRTNIAFELGGVCRMRARNSIRLPDTPRIIHLMALFKERRTPRSIYLSNLLQRRLLEIEIDDREGGKNNPIELL
jgi:hypothetical protein